jgi:hypothetical protein
MTVVNVTGQSAEAPLLTPSIWFVGCGNMAGAMVEGWRSAGVDFSNSVAIRPSGTPVPGLRTVRTLGEAGRPPEIILLGFKPQMLRELAPGLNNWITSRARGRSSAPCRTSRWLCGAVPRHCTAPTRMTRCARGCGSCS